MNGETLCERIRNRLPEAEAREVLAALERAKGDEIFDHMSAGHSADLVRHYRQEARYAIRQYRLWRYRDAFRQLAKALHDQEGRLLLQSARAAAALYLDARGDHQDLTALATPKDDR